MTCRPIGRAATRLLLASPQKVQDSSLFHSVLYLGKTNELDMEGYPKLAVLQGQNPELAMIIPRFLDAQCTESPVPTSRDSGPRRSAQSIYKRENINSDETKKKTHSRSLHYLSQPNVDGIHNSQFQGDVQSSLLQILSSNSAEPCLSPSLATFNLLLS
jgi:hypothetical protein